MSYMGLFWETGMPEAWALSRKSEERPMTAAAECWPQNSVNLRSPWDTADVVPGDNAGRPVPKPKPDDGKTEDR